MKAYNPKQAKVHESEGIHSILERLLKKMGLHEEGKEARDKLYQLQAAWDQLIGHPACLHTSLFSIKKNRLTILVDSPAWFHELNLHGKKPIMDILKKNFSFIKDVRFKIGNVKEKD
jgi:hypothetical protein